LAQATVDPLLSTVKLCFLIGDWQWHWMAKSQL
jgi:hypothetical protein